MLKASLSERVLLAVISTLAALSIGGSASRFCHVFVTRCHVFTFLSHIITCYNVLSRVTTCCNVL